MLRHIADDASSFEHRKTFQAHAINQEMVKSMYGVQVRRQPNAFGYESFALKWIRPVKRSYISVWNCDTPVGQKSLVYHWLSSQQYGTKPRSLSIMQSSCSGFHPMTCVELMSSAIFEKIEAALLSFPATSTTITVETRNIFGLLMKQMPGWPCFSLWYRKKWKIIYRTM